MVKARFQAATRQFGVDLWPRAMHQHQPNAQRREQVAIVSQALSALARRHLTAKTDDEGLAPEGVDVGRGTTHPGNELGGGVIGCRHGRHGGAQFSVHAFTAKGAGKTAQASHPVGGFANGGILAEALTLRCGIVTPAPARSARPAARRAPIGATCSLPGFHKSPQRA